MCLTKYLGYLKDPAFRAVILRQSAPQLSVSGGIIDESHQIYPYFGGVYRAQAKKWIFPSGATIQFAAIGDDRDLPGWQGSQLTNILVDEAAEWTEKQILFLLSRLRSATFKGKLQCVLSANPNNQSYLYKWVEPLLDPKTGIPKEDTRDIVRYFVNVNDKLRWGNSPEELYEEWGKGKELGVDFIPKSFRFVPLSIHGNKVLLANNPEYLANLMSQSKVNQLRFLHGSWTAIPDGGTYWKPEFCKKINIDDLPPDCSFVRGWDLSSQEPSTTTPNPDWSCGVKLAYSKSAQRYYVVDVVRFRKRTHDVLRIIAETAWSDGEGCPQVIPKDPGGAGAIAHTYMMRELAENGVYAVTEVVSGHSNKLQRFLPFASLCESGNCDIVKGDWLEDFEAELSQFTGGTRGSGERGVKDDQVDSVASAFKRLANQKTMPTFILPNMVRDSPVPV